MEKKKRDKHYKLKCIRVDDEVWEAFKQKREASGLSWNMFLCHILGRKRPYYK